jgi:hypothetical protein
MIASDCTEEDGHVFKNEKCLNCGASYYLDAPSDSKSFYIDITPTWSGILPALLQMYLTGDNQDYAEAELQKMARVADEYVKLAKKDFQL